MCSLHLKDFWCDTVYCSDGIASPTSMYIAQPSIHYMTIYGVQALPTQRLVIDFMHYSETCNVRPPQGTIFCGLKCRMVWQQRWISHHSGITSQVSLCFHVSYPSFTVLLVFVGLVLFAVCLGFFSLRGEHLPVCWSFLLFFGFYKAEFTMDELKI